MQKYDHNNDVNGKLKRNKVLREETRTPKGKSRTKQWNLSLWPDQSIGPFFMQGLYIWTQTGSELMCKTI